MVKKILVTGFSGFVSKHLLDTVFFSGPDAVILGVDLVEPDFVIPKNCSFKKMDLLNEESVQALVKSFQPQLIIHLASFSKVSDSWINPISSFKNNTNIFLNLIEAVRNQNSGAKFLSIGSSEEYGIVDLKSMPLNEEHALNPNSPYSVARVSQEWMSKVYAQGYGMNVIITRSFNHYGIYQHDNFVIPSLVKQLCAIKKNGGTAKLFVGNIDVVRDFINVRDVVKAYIILLERGKSSEVYNICTGRGISLREVIQIISKKLDLDPQIVIDKSLYRPNDNPIIIGDNSKLRVLGWAPEISLELGLDEMIEYYLAKS